MNKENSAEMIKTLTQISKMINSNLYLDDILEMIVEITAEIVDSKICSLWLFNGDEKVFKLRATQSKSDEYIKKRSLKFDESVIGQTARDKKIVVIPNVIEEPLYHEKELAKKVGLCSMLNVPMTSKGKVVGVISCYTEEPHTFSDFEMNLVTLVANQSCIAIENAELMYKNKAIEEELNSRITFERAKKILMKIGKIKEGEADERIRQYSQNHDLPIEEIVKAIILTDSLVPERKESKSNPRKPKRIKKDSTEEGVPLFI
jgi:signal transduction protein with GAF and PtsI domain